MHKVELKGEMSMKVETKKYLLGTVLGLFLWTVAEFILGGEDKFDTSFWLIFGVVAVVGVLFAIWRQIYKDE